MISSSQSLKDEPFHPFSKVGVSSSAPRCALIPRNDDIIPMNLMKTARLHKDRHSCCRTLFEV